VASKPPGRRPANRLRLARVKAPVFGPAGVIRLLVEGNEAVARTARKAIPVGEKAGDAPTVDLLTQRLQTHEKAAWMLRSLLES